MKYGDKMNKEKSGKLKSEMNEFANMPQEVKHKMYPKQEYGIECNYRDTLDGIDAYASENYKKVMKQKRSASEG